MKALEPNGIYISRRLGDEEILVFLSRAIFYNEIINVNIDTNKNSYKDLALYRAYTNANNLEEREQIYERLNSLFDDFLREFDKIYDKKLYSIKEK